MSKNTTFDVIIIGGGLAGLTASIHLSTFKKRVLLIEKNEYPKHKVCGEYISNEVLPYLKSLGIDPIKDGAKQISKVKITTVKSNLISGKLPLGGFGMSRYFLDNLLANKAISKGVKILQKSVESVEFSNDVFLVKTNSSITFKSKIAVGSFGKRSTLDVKMNREFIKKKSPYLAVKTYVQGVFPEDVVALHNFKGGYCGVSKVENDAINLCYITNYKSFKKHKNIREFQEQIIFQNKYLKEVFSSSKELFSKPLSISQISFESKKPIENHIIMCGDTAGMIHPLCGNGMGMAISSAQIASNEIIRFLNQEITRTELEKNYLRNWNRAFKIRLKAGHFIAWLFRNQKISEFAYSVLRRFPSLLPKIIKFTHGKKLKPI